MLHCNKIHHWKRNCSKYLNDKKASASISCVYVIRVNYASTTSWVFVSGCGSHTHICTNVQGLTRSRKLAKIAIELRVANGAQVSAAAVRIYSILLPSRLI